MRISDWSSDVCSSDLLQGLLGPGLTPQYTQGYTKEFRGGCFVEAGESGLVAKAAARQELAPVMGRIGGYVARRRLLRGSTRISVADGPGSGRASCRERVCQDVKMWVVEG